MKKYKILSLLLALIFSVSILVACGPQGTVGSNTNSTDTHSVSSSGVSSTSSDTNTESSDTDTETDSESSDTETENKAAENALPKEYWVEEPGKKYAQNFVVVCMQPSKKGHYDYLVTDFPEAEAIDVCINGWSEFNTVKLALLLKTPSKENVISTIRALEKRDDIYKVTPLYDIEFVPFEFTETTEFTNDYIYCSIQPSAAHRTYTVEDFPELDCVSVEEASWSKSITKRLKIKLKYPSKENVIAAVNLLSTSNREDLYYVCPDIILYPSDAPADATYVANTTSTTEPWEIAKMNLIGA